MSLFVTFSYLNRITDCDDFWHRDTWNPVDDYKLLFFMKSEGGRN